MSMNRWEEDFDDFDDEMTFRTPGYASDNNLEDLRMLIEMLMRTGRFATRREAVDWVAEQEFVHVEEDGLVFTVTRPVGASQE